MTTASCAAADAGGAGDTGDTGGSPSDGAGSGGRTGRSRQREAAMLAAAAELVGELGYARVTCDAVAARARSSKATIYRRWPGGKAELVAESLRRSAQGLVPADLPKPGSLRGDLLLAVAGIVGAITGAGGGTSLLGLVDGVRDDAVLRQQVRAQIERGGVEAGQTIRDRAVERGELEPAADVSRVLHLAVGQLLLGVLLDAAPPGARRQQRLVDDVLLPLLAPSQSGDAPPR